MIDFNKIMTEELEESRKGNIFRAPQPEPKVEHVSKKPPIGTSAENPYHITIDGETDLNGEFGPQQVQSLLGLVVDFPLSKKMKDAGDDADAIHHLNKLNSHRGG